MKLKLKSIYLAHSPTMIEDAIKIQVGLEKYGYVVCNPFQKQGFAQNGQSPLQQLIPGKNVVHGDLKDVADNDIIIAIFPESPSIGIPCEMMMGWMLHKTVISVTTQTIFNHPWIQYMSDDVILYGPPDSLINMLLKSIAWCEIDKEN